jgi:hypothetical protein
MSPENKERPADELIVITTYFAPWEAHIAKSKLEAEGIAAYIADEHLVGQQWLYANAVGGVKLMVSRRDILKASHALGLQAAQQKKEATEAGNRPWWAKVKDILLGFGGFYVFGIPILPKRKDKPED